MLKRKTPAGFLPRAVMILVLQRLLLSYRFQIGFGIAVPNTIRIFYRSVVNHNVNVCFSAASLSFAPLFFQFYYWLRRVIEIICCLLLKQFFLLSNAFNNWFALNFQTVIFSHRLSSLSIPTRNLARPIKNSAKLHDIRVTGFYQLLGCLFTAPTAAAVHHDKLLLVR